MPLRKAELVGLGLSFLYKASKIKIVLGMKEVSLFKYSGCVFVNFQ